MEKLAERLAKSCNNVTAHYIGSVEANGPRADAVVYSFECPNGKTYLYASRGYTKNKAIECPMADNEEALKLCFDKVIK
jgi:hypothetical protein